MKKKQVSLFLIDRINQDSISVLASSHLCQSASAYPHLSVLASPYFCLSVSWLVCITLFLSILACPHLCLGLSISANPNLFSVYIYVCLFVWAKPHSLSVLDILHFLSLLVSLYLFFFDWSTSVSLTKLIHISVSLSWLD